MKLIQLQYFHAVCVYKSVSAASQYLHVSQPAVSFAIKELEKEFGVALFKRHYRGMVLTAEGEQLFRQSCELIRNFEQIEKRMLDLGAKRKVIRLGIPPMIGSLLLSGIYRKFVRTNKDIRLDIFEGGYNELINLLSEDMVDMVFLAHTQPIDNRMEVLEIADFDIVCCVSADSPLSELTIISPADLKDTPVVLFKDDFFQTGEIKKWFAKSGVQPEILLQTHQLSTMQNVVSENLAAGFMFRQLAERNPQFVSIPLEDPINAHISLVRKKDSYLSDCMKRLIGYIKTNNPLK